MMDSAYSKNSGVFLNKTFIILIIVCQIRITVVWSDRAFMFYFFSLSFLYLDDYYLSLHPYLFS
jgi:hypothetical protein